MTELLAFEDENKIEIGIDEAGRGCLFGEVFIAGVILPKNIKELMEEEKIIIKDSKKLSKKRRKQAREFIERVAIDYCVISKNNKIIDEKNILNATIEGMHDVIDKIETKPNKILVDGNRFKFYRDKNGELIEHKCVTGGDNKYLSIASASILAKTNKDEYIEKIVNENPELEKYDLVNNSGYGTKKHIEAIKKYGTTQFHRKSFGLCAIY